MNQTIADLWAGQNRDATALDTASLARAEARLRRRIRRRDAGEYAAGLLAGAIFAKLAVETPDWGVRAGCAAILLGLVVVMVNLWRRRPRAPDAALGEPILAFHRAQLVAQRDALASVWRWYLAPVVPGMVLFLLAITRATAEHMPLGAAALGVALAGGIVAGVFWGIHRLNLRAARRLDAMIDALDRGEG